MLPDNEALLCLLMSPQQIASVHPEMLQLSVTKLCFAASNNDLKKKIPTDTKNSSEDRQVVSVTDTPVNERVNIHPPSQTTIM